MAIAWLIHQQYLWFEAQRQGPLTAERVKDFFPAAVSLGPVDPHSGVQRVLNESGSAIGLVAQTAPASDKFIGYAGPTNSLIAMDAQGRVTGIRILRSEDTPDHLSTVLRKRSFFDGFKGLKMGDLKELPTVDAVSGATLTSTAIAQGILNRLGGEGPSLRFPEDITLAEVQTLLPEAAALESSSANPGLFMVRDKNGATLARVTRTAPQSDTVIGYKGPTDTLVLLNAEGTHVEAFRLRKSFDTKDYVGYVTGDKFFPRLFEQMPLERLATLNFNEAKIEGVSGATETSWAVAEGLKRKAAKLTEPLLGDFGKMILKPVDAGLLLVIVLSLLMTFTSLRGKRWARWVHQIALIGYAGFYCGFMLSQGLLVGWARHGLPWQTAPVLVLLLALALALPLFIRRQFYCHHYCPHGALQQWLSRLKKKHYRVPLKLGHALEKLPLILLVIILLAVMLDFSININAMEAFDAWLILIAGWGTLLVAAAGLIFSFFTPMAYCRYGCPTGALLKFMRYAGEADGFSKKDVMALALVLLAAAIHWQREALSLWFA